MFHGIYVRTKPTNKWYLFSITKSAETATQELILATEQAKKFGNDQGEAVIQVFDSAIFMPELLTEIKQQKILGFN